MLWYTIAMSEVVADVRGTRGWSAEYWGYLMWGLAALAIAGPELASVFGVGDWPTISATIGHLEAAHSWVRLVVVFVIVVLGYYAVPQLLAHPSLPRIVPGQQTTANGRATRDAEAVRSGGMGWYLVLAVGGLVVGLVVAAGARHMHPGTYAGAYVLYGLIAVLWVIVPSVLAMFFAREVPFPTLFRTIGYLERRAHPIAAIILALLVILLLHLALYPWPRYGS